MKIGWSGTSRRPSEPQSGLVSTATTRSRRRKANTDPSRLVFERAGGGGATAGVVPCRGAVSEREPHPAQGAVWRQP
jgi:hypothetical protein